MTATNHVATGALVGALIGSPVAVPLAFGLHFVLDSLPHYNLEDGDDHGTTKFLYSLALDFGLAFGILVSIFFLSPDNMWTILLSGVACASPDLMWFWPWVQELQGKKFTAKSRIMLFHSRIQKYARHTLENFIIELVWLVIVLGLLGANLA